MGPFVCDFICRECRLLVEVDGGHHDARQSQDASRTRYLEAKGYRVLRFWNNEVLENIEGVLTVILQTLESRPPPAPPAGGRGGK